MHSKAQLNTPQVAFIHLTVLVEFRSVFLNGGQSICSHCLKPSLAVYPQQYNICPREVLVWGYHSSALVGLTFPPAAISSEALVDCNYALSVLKFRDTCTVIQLVLLLCRCKPQVNNCAIDYLHVFASDYSNFSSCLFLKYIIFFSNYAFIKHNQTIKNDQIKL